VAQVREYFQTWEYLGGSLLVGTISDSVRVELRVFYCYVCSSLS
jgi:hypothetical protein